MFTIADAVAQEYQRLFIYLRETVRRIPDREWTRGERLTDEPVRQVCHVLWALDPKERAPFGRAVVRFSRKLRDDEKPSRAAVLGWLDEVAEDVDRWAREQIEAARSVAYKNRPPAATVIYALRHAALHLGCLHGEMHRRDIPTAPFKRPAPAERR